MIRVKNCWRFMPYWDILIRDENRRKNFLWPLFICMETIHVKGGIKCLLLI